MSRSRLEELLVCPDPKCHSKLARVDRFLVCETCGRRYPIDDKGIPHMLISEGDKHRVVKG